MTPPIISAFNDTVVLNENETVNINIQDNDSAFLGLDSTSLNIIYGVNNGSLFMNIDGSIDYTPDNNFYGVDSFVYSICDSAIVANCDSALVFIIINTRDSFNFTACDSLILNSDTYIVNQINIDTFITASVWDSIVVSVIEINNTIEIVNPNIVNCD